MGTLNINSFELNVILPVDISHFNPHLENIESILGITQSLCKQTRVVQIDSECNSKLQPLIARLQDAKREFASISYLIDNRNKRSAWIGGVGTIFKHIFGSLDENDGIKYDEAIKSLQNNEKQLASLMKENILITTSTLEYYNNTLHRIKDNEVNLSLAIDKLSMTVNNITRLTDGLQLLAEINQILHVLDASILTISFQLEDLVNAILFSSQNVLHPAIITPKQLYEELVNNYRHLPSDIELPVSLDINSMHVIFKISRLACYFISNKIIFVLQVPLVNIKEYVLFHNVALPTPYSSIDPSSFSLILPNNKYIAMTKDKSHYCVFDSLEICKPVTPGKFICDIKNVYSTDAKITCESELLAKVISVKPVQCETRTIVGKLDIWKPLTNNKWIYIQSEPNKISIDCLNSKLYETNILGTGILNVPKDCTVYCKTSTLIPKRDIVNITSPINHYPEFNLINDTCCNLSKLDNKIKSVPPVYLHDVDLDEFNSKDKTKINSILRDLENIEQQPPHIVKYGTHFSVLLLIISVFVFVFLLYVTYKKFCKSGSNRFFLFNFNKPPLQPTSDIELTEVEAEGTETIPSPAPLRTRV